MATNLYHETVYKLLFFSLVLIAAGYPTRGQPFAQPATGKALVYFVRPSSGGALINFRYFDGDHYLGKTNGVNYFTYECEPGEHIFWVAAENRDFVRGRLQADATYVLEVQPRVGAIKAAVQLQPVSPDDTQRVKKITKLIRRKEPKPLKGQGDDMAFFIKNGMDRYRKVQDTKKVAVLDTNCTF